MNYAVAILVGIIAATAAAFGGYYLGYDVGFETAVEQQKGNAEEPDDFGDNTSMHGSINSFEECVAAGNAVMESYPRQCRSADGQLFVEDISNDDLNAVPDHGAPPSSGYAQREFDGCAIAGCSGQLCVEASEASGIITTCEYRPEYACYENVRCERQTTGQCGWTEDATLRACLMQSSS